MRPPTRMSCTACRNNCAPGTCAVLGRMRLITSSALILRSFSGFNAINMRALFAAADEPDHAIHSRVLPHDLLEGREFVPHRGKGDVLRPLNTAHQTTRVLLREESLGHDDVQVHAKADGPERHSSISCG